MAKQFSDEELAQKRADAGLRDRIQNLFSENPTVRLDAQEALKESWNYYDPSFELSELATMEPQACALAAMRRDTAKEFINWLIKL